MNGLKRFYHFLGGIRFAILLIALAACTVVAGTLLESKTESHLLAIRWTYGHPLFQLLLCLFFINILFSALRRWPFKKKHIPFLMTHLGLLMILTGTILKNRYGLQGNLSVWEGSGNHHVMIPHSHAIMLEKKGENTPLAHSSMISLNSFHRSVYTPSDFPDVKCKLVGYAPHVQERLETWIKGDRAFAAGLPPLKVQEWNPGDPLPEFTDAPLTRGSSPSWSLAAFRTPAMDPILETLYLHDLILCLQAKDEMHSSFSIPLQQALEKNFSFAGLDWRVTLTLGIQSGTLQLLGKTSEGVLREKLTVALQGQQALYVQSDPKQWSEAGFTVDLNRKSSLLCFVEDQAGNTFILAFDPYGRIHGECFRQDELQTIIAYDQGYGGYAVQATLPFPAFPASRQNKEEADAEELVVRLKQAMAGSPPLAPPLSLLEQGCTVAQVDFASTFVQFLMEWNRTPGILFNPIASLPHPLEKVLSQLNWNEVSEIDLKASHWTERLLGQLEQSLIQGEDPLKVLERNRWPFLSELRGLGPSEEISPASHFTRQVFSLAAYLPPISQPTPKTVQEHALLLSAYLRGYGIDHGSLLAMKENGAEQFDRLETYWMKHSSDKIKNFEKSVTLETSLSRSIYPEDSPLKLEDHRPGIAIEVEKGGQKQFLALAYDPAGTGLKWPILDGAYIIRFQPQLRELPYRLRLRQARQITYPNSPQVYSYESDLLITENGKEAVAETLSMNRVYETWDGYRFYLSGVGTAGDQGLKRVQLVVNHDPAKYWLTYPGALLVFLGAFSLFWGRSFRKNRDL